MSESEDQEKEQFKICNEHFLSKNAGMNFIYCLLIILLAALGTGGGFMISNSGTVSSIKTTVDNHDKEITDLKSRYNDIDKKLDILISRK